MDFVKGGVNIPSTGSFNTRHQWDNRARQGSSTIPAAIPPVRPGKRTAAPTSLVYGNNEAVYELVECIIESEMRISIKALLFQMYKSPPRE